LGEKEKGEEDEEPSVVALGALCSASAHAALQAAGHLEFF